MAARGARAAGRAHAAYWRADERGRGRCGRTGPRRGFPAGSATIGLGRRPRRADRLPLGAGDAGRFHRYAEELLALAPDVILASATPSVQALQQATRTVPIVFANVGDPVALGFVDSLARPGGNTTGFTPYEFGFAAKWLELLKEIAPRVTRVAVLRDLTIGPAHLSAIQAVAPSFNVELSVVGVRDASEIERSVTAFARSSNGGMIVTASTSALVHRDLITMLAARHGLPAVYSFRYMVTAGGLISYGPDPIDFSAVRPATSIASSRARSRRTCRCKRRPSTSW